MKHFYSLIILICLAGTGQSQINSYFNNNPCWTQKDENPVGVNCFQATLYNYYTNGDTLIGTYQYKKVYEKGQNYYQCYCPVPPPSTSPCFNPGPPVPYGPVLSLFIRSSGKKIFFLFGSKDTLLYDFNLKVGDTLPTTFNNPSPNIKKVTSIDSISTLNGWMKRFYIDGSTNDYILEGMGHTHGLIKPVALVLCSCSYGLTCYSQNNTSYFPTISSVSCLLPTGINEVITNTSPILYPNPSEGKYLIRFPEFSANSRIEIYNLPGQLIRSFIPQSETLEIDIQKEKAGVYFLKYISNGETKSVKLIKE